MSKEIGDHILLLGNPNQQDDFLLKYISALNEDDRFYRVPCKGVLEKKPKKITDVSSDQLNSLPISLVICFDLNEVHFEILNKLDQNKVRFLLAPRHLLADKCNPLYNRSILRINSWYAPYLQYLLKAFPVEQCKPAAISYVSSLTNGLTLTEIMEPFILCSLLLQIEKIVVEVAVVKNQLFISGNYNDNQSLNLQFCKNAASQFNKTTVNYEQATVEISIPSKDTIDRPGFIEIHENNKIKEHLAPYDFSLKYNDFNQLNGSVEMMNRVLSEGQLLNLPSKLIDSARNLIKNIPNDFLA